MSSNKTEHLNMRVRPETKRALQEIARVEKRSMANALECLIEDYLARNQIDVPLDAPLRERQVPPALGGVS